MGPNPELFKRVATIYGLSGLFLVLSFTFSDRVLAFAGTNLVVALLVISIVVGAAVTGQRMGLKRIAGLPAPWPRVIGISLASWIFAYIISLIVGFLPALLLGGWVVSVLQLIFFSLLASWLYLNWGLDEASEDNFEVPSTQQPPEPVRVAPEPVAYESPVAEEYDPEESRIQARREKLLSDAEVDDDLLSE